MKRDAVAARRFFRKAYAHPGNLPAPVINVYKNRRLSGRGQKLETERHHPATLSITTM